MLTEKVKVVRTKRASASVKAKRKRSYRKRKAKVKRMAKVRRRKSSFKRKEKRRKIIRKRLRIKPGSKKRLRFSSVDIVANLIEAIKNHEGDLVENVKLNSTLQYDIYYVNFGKLPDEAKKKLESAKVEVENSKYTVYEDAAFVRAEVEVNGALWAAEISLGSVDIKDSDYKYDDEEQAYIDDQGRIVDSDEYAEATANELYSVTELKNMDVYLTHIKDLEMETIKEDKNKKVAEYQIIDHGMENSSYFQGHGIMGSKWDDVATGVGSTVEDAMEDALEQIAQLGWDISEELESEANEIKREHGKYGVGTSLTITAHVNNGEVEDFHVDASAALISDDEQNEDVDSDIAEGAGQIQLSATTLDIGPAVNVMIDACEEAGVKIPTDKLNKLEKEIQSIQDMNEHYYYISIDVKEDGPEEKESLTPFFVRTPKKESKEDKKVSQLKESINEFKAALSSDNKIAESFKKSAELADKLHGIYTSLEQKESAPVEQKKLTESVSFAGLELDLPSFDHSKTERMDEDVEVTLGLKQKKEVVSEEVSALRGVISDLKQLSEDAKKLMVAAEKNMVAEDDANTFLSDMGKYLQEAIVALKTEDKESDDAEEIQLYADNTGSIYPKKLEILKRIERDLKKGQTKEMVLRKHTHAIYLWLRNAAEMYQTEVEKKKFSKGALKMAADSIAKGETEEIIHQIEKYGSAYEKPVSEGKWSPDVKGLVSYAMNVESLYNAIQSEKKKSSPDWEQIADAIISSYEASTEGKLERQYEGTTDELAAEIESEFGGEIDEAKKKEAFSDEDVASYLENWRESDGLNDFNLALDRGLILWAAELIHSGGALDQEISNNPEMEKHILNMLKKAGKRAIESERKELLKNVEIWEGPHGESYFIPQVDVDYFLSQSDLKRMNAKFSHGYDAKGKEYKTSVLDESKYSDGDPSTEQSNIKALEKAKADGSRVVYEYLPKSKERGGADWHSVEILDKDGVVRHGFGWGDLSPSIKMAKKMADESVKPMKEASGGDTISKIQSILANKQSEKIDGTLVDLTTANAIMTVYKALSKEENKQKFSAMPVSKMAKMAFQLIK